MKSLTAVLAGAALMFLTSTLSWAAPGDGLIGTNHDFTLATGTTPTAAATTTVIGLCTFCHTPHKAESTLLLWNHTLSANTFSWDVPSTTAGTTFPTFTGTGYKGPTAKCLSCHDGSVAIGDIAWFLEEKPPTPLNPTTHTTGEFNIGGGGSMMGNHPVAMPYPYSGGGSTYNGTTTGSSIVIADWQPNPTANNIRLFQDDGAGNITAGPAVGRTGLECSSCHDPHNRAATEDLFLRGKLVGSSLADGYLCLQCHVK
jgi:hypothetical protein